MKYLSLLFLLIPFSVLAVDEATVQAIDTKASNANTKANDNNSRIQALESEDLILHNRIDTIELTAGPKGDKGDAGAAGIQGLKGDEGVAGVQGLKGDAGVAGLQGSKGEIGPAGADGLSGLSGLNCWDQNQNRNKDASEDINNDGVFNTLDCLSQMDLSSLLTRISYLENRLENNDFDNDGYTPASGDCNDANSSINPNQTEINNDGIDNNCDGVFGELTLIDSDGDGFYASESGGDDCDDSLANIYPGAAEITDGLDNDCDGVIDNHLFVDFDGDGYFSAASGGDDCDDASSSIHPGAVEVSDGLDNDCDGFIDNLVFTDVDRDGYSSVSSGGDDCDDSLQYVYPGAAEFTDGLDNDCDGVIDNIVLTSFEFEIMQLHNSIRASVEPAPDFALPQLVWNASLASTAQQWADACNYSHNPDRGAVGENIALIYSNSDVSTVDIAVSLWGDESVNYDYDSNSCTSGEICGHYTQIIWRDSTNIGCGIAICSGCQFLVCNYSPAGNFTGQPPY